MGSLSRCWRWFYCWRLALCLYRPRGMGHLILAMGQLGTTEAMATVAMATEAMAIMGAMADMLAMGGLVLGVHAVVTLKDMAVMEAMGSTMAHTPLAMAAMDST